ncbi:hypothetical protein [Mycobacteroides abscessus]|uniref:hypothetical protein n=1 Tax=Mycobacteroides abscessus TaxID=36809 RepID=UPI0009C5BD5D|nr:hypothetical protein [Mycobacteroides abscessus]SLH41410.1 Uncharacterised protein [Mycobacteroides abscessus subsp. massiliense]
MSTRRPWKVHFHHDGTKVFSPEESMPQAYTIDTSRPIDGTSAHSDDGAAHAAARQVSRNGGSARVTYCDPETGVVRQVRTYAPYETALEDLADRLS